MCISNIVKWFQLAKPEPTVEDVSVQIGCHFEEVAEMASVTGDANLQSSAESAGDHYKNKDPHYIEGIELLSLHDSDKIELLDALCDQIVTATGIAHMMGMDIEGALKEVDRSNWSKFVDDKPVFNEQGKIAKPDSYSPPELAEFI